MRKIFIVILSVLILASVFISLDDSENNKFTPIKIVLAADQSNFQNTSPWFVAWWNKVTSEAQNVVQWFQQKTKSVLSGGQSIPQTQNSLSQYPTISGQKSINDQQMSFPIQQQSSSGSDSSSQQGGEENGSQGNTYKLEPNQFKKMCGQNTYVLYWRKGGKNGRDMAQPVQQGPGAGKNQGARDYWQLPTCEELAQCHCCCNTCIYEPPLCKEEGWTFDKPFSCYPKKICSKCNEVCNPECSKWNKPDYPTLNQQSLNLNRDCQCQKEGCKDTGSKGCNIIIMDPGKTQVDYTTSEEGCKEKCKETYDGCVKTCGNDSKCKSACSKSLQECEAGCKDPEKYFKGTGVAYFKNGNGAKDERSKLIAEPNDKASPGYVNKLKDQKGVCCKCYQDGPPIQ